MIRGSLAQAVSARVPHGWKANRSVTPQHQFENTYENEKRLFLIEIR